MLNLFRRWREWIQQRSSAQEGAPEPGPQEVLERSDQRADLQRELQTLLAPVFRGLPKRDRRMILLHAAGLVASAIHVHVMTRNDFSDDALNAIRCDVSRDLIQARQRHPEMHSTRWVLFAIAGHTARMTLQLERWCQESDGLPAAIKLPSPQELRDRN